jgi:hypothetical protein
MPNSNRTRFEPTTEVVVFLSSTISSSSTTTISAVDFSTGEISADE